MSQSDIKHIINFILTFYENRRSVEFIFTINPKTKCFHFPLTHGSNEKTVLKPSLRWNWDPKNEKEKDKHVLNFNSLDANATRLKEATKNIGLLNEAQHNYCGGSLASSD